jgi:hypothetical protein
VSIKIESFSNQSSEDRQRLKDFVAFHWDYYRTDLRYVPLLDYEYLGSKLLGITGFFEPDNLFFKRAEARFFIAYRDSKPVGRCMAFVNRAHEKHWRDGVGFFGHFECIEDREVAAALLGEAEKWLRFRGKLAIRGPLNLPVNEATPGFLVEGFESRPIVYYHFNPAFYAPMLIGLGYTPKMDYLSYEVRFPDNPIESALAGISKRIIKRSNITFETWSDRKLDIRKQEMFSIYNDAWRDNFGFVPFTRKQLDKIIDDMKLIMNKKLFLFAYVDGKVAAFFGAVPNIFESLALKENKRKSELLRAVKVLMCCSRTKGFRIGYLGVKKTYRNLGLDAVLIWKQNELVLKTRYQYCDMGWVLSENKPMIKMIERCGGKLSKRYRVFEKRLQN